MKPCSQCGEAKSAEEFYPSKVQPCRDCHRAKVRARREADPEADAARKRAYTESGRHAELQRNRDLKRYGLTLEKRDDMALGQGNLCGICGLEEETVNPRSGQIRSLAVDHDHTTGQVRALLCNRCNQGLGMFRDDPDLLIAASVYLTLHRTPARRTV